MHVTLSSIPSITDLHAHAHCGVTQSWTSTPVKHLPSMCYPNKLFSSPYMIHCWNQAVCTLKRSPSSCSRSCGVPVVWLFCWCFQVLKPLASHSQSMFYQWCSIFFRVEWNIPDVEEKMGWYCNDIQTSHRDLPVKVEKHLWGHSVQDFSPVSFVLCVERRLGEGWPEKTHCHHIVFGCWYCQLSPKEETASLLGWLD